MSYIEKNLLTDESIRFFTKKHWVIFLMPVIFTLIGFVLWLQQDLLVLLGYLFLFIALYFWISTITTYITSEYGVTNKRVLIKIGFIQRQTWETLLPKIASLEVSQSILGRVLGYGTLIIQSTGGGKDAFPTINNPLTFRRKVQESAELMQVNMPAMAETPIPDKPVIENNAQDPRERL